MDKKNLQKILDKVLLENDWKILYNMSTSGDFIVKQCINSKKENFILKIRKRKSKRLKQQFINEIFINIFLEKYYKNDFPYKVVYYDISEGEETLLYKMVEGRTLNGYYFLIGKRNAKYYNPKKIIDLISLVQQQGDKFIAFDDNIKLEKKGYEKSKHHLLKYEEIYNTYFGNDYFLRIKGFIKSYKKLFDDNLTLSHGDLNPKNVLISNDNIVTLIDWTDISLGNSLSDISKFYLASWNVKSKQKELKKLALEKNNNNEKLFNLNILILTGEFIKILNDSYNGVIKDFENGDIDNATKNKLVNEIFKAREYTIETYRNSFRYMTNSFLEKDRYEEHFDKFVVKKFVVSFLNKNRIQLNLKGQI